MSNDRLQYFQKAFSTVSCSTKLFSTSQLVASWKLYRRRTNVIENLDEYHSFQSELSLKWLKFIVVSLLIAYFTYFLVLSSYDVDKENLLFLMLSLVPCALVVIPGLIIFIFQFSNKWCCFRLEQNIADFFMIGCILSLSIINIMTRVFPNITNLRHRSPLLELYLLHHRSDSVLLLIVITNIIQITLKRNNWRYIISAWAISFATLIISVCFDPSIGLLPIFMVCFNIIIIREFDMYFRCQYHLMKIHNNAYNNYTKNYDLESNCLQSNTNSNSQRQKMERRLGKVSPKHDWSNSQRKAAVGGTAYSPLSGAAAIAGQQMMFAANRSSSYRNINNSNNNSNENSCISISKINPSNNNNNNNDNNSNNNINNSSPSLKRTGYLSNRCLYLGKQFSFPNNDTRKNQIGAAESNEDDDYEEAVGGLWIPSKPKGNGGGGGGEEESKAPPLCRMQSDTSTTLFDMFTISRPQSARSCLSSHNNNNNNMKSPYNPMTGPSQPQPHTQPTSLKESTTSRKEVRDNSSSNSAVPISYYHNLVHDLRTPMQAFMAGFESLDKLLRKTNEILKKYDHTTTPPPDNLTTSPAYSSSSSHQSITEEIVLGMDTVKSLMATCSVMTMGINRVMDFSKYYENTPLSCYLETINLLETIMWSIDCVRVIQAKLPIILEPLPSDLCSHVITDKLWMQENLLCLVSNAVKYSTLGLVTVRLQLLEHISPETLQRSRMLVVEVEDNGPGISLEESEHIFNVDAQEERAQGGTGLGLFCLGQRVTALGGHYGVKSKPINNQGSIFWFSIPYRPNVTEAGRAVLQSNNVFEVPGGLEAAVRFKRESMCRSDSCGRKSLPTSKSISSIGGDDITELKSPIAPPVIPTPPPPKRGLLSRGESQPNLIHHHHHHHKNNNYSHMKLRRPLHLLVVDDSLPILKLVSKTLQKEGHLVETAENGLLAYNLLTSRSFDVVLMDIQMPVMGGLEAVEKLRQYEQDRGLRKRKIHQVILGMSANGDSATRDAALAAGMDMFMAKPFTIKRFHDTFSEYNHHRGSGGGGGGTGDDLGVRGGGVGEGSINGSSGIGR